MENKEEIGIKRVWCYRCDNYIDIKTSIMPKIRGIWQVWECPDCDTKNRLKL